MTLVVCMKAADGIVLAADSRGTIGDPRGLTAITDTQIKIHQLGKWGLAMAGASEMGAVLLDELQKNTSIGQSANIDELTHLVAEQSRENFTKWFGSISPENRPAVLMTLAGYRFANDKVPEPMIYMLTSQFNFAPQLFTHGPCMSGIPQYAVYLVHRYYDPGILLENAKALAEYLISETASQDPKVGGPIRIAQITPEKGYEELSEADVQRISKRNQSLNKRLREFFIQEATG